MRLNEIYPIPQNEITPTLASVTTTPAIIIPQMIAGIARRSGTLKMNAATQPVHAPVTGRGIATNNIRPNVSNLSINLPLLRVLLKSQVKKRFQIVYCISQFETLSSNSSMGITGRKLPMTANRYASCYLRPPTVIA